MTAKKMGRPGYPGRFQVHLTEADYAQVQAVAEREGRPLSGACRQLIREALAARESQRGKGKVA